MMTGTTDISKVYIKSSKKKVEYATIDYILESLYLMKAKDELPVFKLLDLLFDGKIDSVSFSRDSPHCYFYARMHTDYISMIIRRSEEGKDMEFQVPLKTLKLSMRDSDEDILRP
jgi:hypothetical protein